MVLSAFISVGSLLPFLRKYLLILYLQYVDCFSSYFLFDKLFLQRHVLLANNNTHNISIYFDG